MLQLKKILLSRLVNQEEEAESRGEKAKRREEKADRRAARSKRRLGASVARLPIQLLTLRTLGNPEISGVDAPPQVSRVSLDSQIGKFVAFKIVCDGMTLFAPDLPTSKDDGFLDSLTTKRAWPAETIAATLPFASGKVMLDIGANIGLTSIPRAILRIFEKIHAFEPEPRNFSCLTAAIAENGLKDIISPWPYAVGREGGETKLSLNSGIARHHISSPSDPDALLVPIVSLNEWAKSTKIDLRDVHFVKSDAQGYEPHILAGASSFLSVPNVAWQLEVHPGLMASSGVSNTEFCDMLHSNFAAYLDLRNHEAGLRSIHHVKSIFDNLNSYTDIVAITRGR